MNRFVVPLAAATAIVGFTVPVFAHHSTAMFEWGKEVTISNATVERWDWTNPHTFLYVTVPKAGGGTDRWAFEGMSPSHLARSGWSKRSLKAGDKINLSYFPLRDGRKGGFNISVTLPDGSTIRQLPAGASAQAAR